jgi:ABC-type multidrug transport system fused ATPase/permease subunit
MSDADDADLEAQRARLEARREQWRKEDEERQARRAQWSTRQEERRKNREERDRRWEEVFQAAERENDRLKAQSRALAGMLKLRATVLTIAGTAIGVALIWGASQTTGFWSLLMNALGTGLFVAATVGVAAYFVSGYWKAATETPNEEILSELQEVHNLLSDVSVATDSRHELLARLDFFLMWQEAERQEEQGDREERARELLAKLRERGHLPPETEQENQGEDN